MKIPCALAVVVLAITASAQADWVKAKFKGEVSSNDFKNGLFGDVDNGDKAKLKLFFNTDNYVENGKGNKRGYMIDWAESSLKLGSLNIDLASGLPEDDSFFVLKDKKGSKKDAFYLSTSIGSPGTLMLGDAESDDVFTIDFSAKFEDGKALKSANIMKALGKHKAKDMKKVNWSFSLDQGGGDEVNVDFDKVKFKTVNVPAPAAILGFAPIVLLSRRRRS
jgi:hypothetical protein